MKDAGLITKIYDDFLFNMTILDHIRQREGINDKSQIVLTLEHLEGAFAVLIVGLIISFIVFVIEIITDSQWFKRYLRDTKEYLLDTWKEVTMKFKNKDKRLKLRKKFK